MDLKALQVLAHPAAVVLQMVVELPVPHQALPPAWP
jgi:hypothetical protein